MRVQRKLLITSAIIGLIGAAPAGGDVLFQNFDSFGSQQQISLFTLAAPGASVTASLSTPGTILTDFVSLNPLSSSPTSPNVLNFFMPGRFTLDFSEPVRNVRFTSGAASNGYTVSAQGIKDVPIIEVANALSGLVLKQIADGLVGFEEVARVFPQFTEFTLEGIRDNAAGLSLDLARFIVANPNTIADIAGINDPEFRGITTDLGRIVFRHGLYESNVSFPFIDQGVAFAGQTASLGGIDRLVFDATGADIVIDNFQVQRLPLGYRALNGFFDSVDTLLNSSSSKNVLTLTTLGAFAVSVAGAVATSGFGAAALLTGQAVTVKATSAIKAVGVGAQVFSAYDPFWTPFDVIYSRPDVAPLRLDSTSGLSDSLVQAFNDYFDGVAAASETARTLEQTIIRYSTAGIQGDLKASVDQGNFAVELYEQFHTHLASAGAAAEILAKALEAEPEFDIFVDDAAIQSFLNDLITNGFPEIELEVFRQFGISDLEINQMRQDLIDVVAEVRPGSMSAAFDDIGAGFKELSSELAQLSAEVVEFSPFSLSIQSEAAFEISDLVVKFFDWNGSSTFLFPSLDPFGNGLFELAGRDAANFHSFAVFSETRPIFGLELFDQRLGELPFEVIFGDGAYDAFLLMLTDSWPRTGFC
jgi:hypothetical protein